MKKNCHLPCKNFCGEGLSDLLVSSVIEELQASLQEAHTVYFFPPAFFFKLAYFVTMKTQWRFVSLKAPVENGRCNSLSLLHSCFQLECGLLWLYQRLVVRSKQLVFSSALSKTHHRGLQQEKSLLAQHVVYPRNPVLLVELSALFLYREKKRTIM